MRKNEKRLFLNFIQVLEFNQLINFLQIHLFNRFYFISIKYNY